MKFKKFVEDIKAELTIGKIIMLVLGVYVIAALIPGAITTLSNTSTTGWDASTIALWGIIPLIVIISIVWGILPKFRR